MTGRYQWQWGSLAALTPQVWTLELFFYRFFFCVSSFKSPWTCWQMSFMTKSTSPKPFPLQQNSSFLDLLGVGLWPLWCLDPPQRSPEVVGGPKICGKFTHIKHLQRKPVSFCAQGKYQFEHLEDKQLWSAVANGFLRRFQCSDDHPKKQDPTKSIKIQLQAQHLIALSLARLGNVGDEFSYLQKG